MVEVKDIAILVGLAWVMLEGRKIIEIFKPRESQPINIDFPDITFPDIVIPDTNVLAKTISDMSLGISRSAFDFVADYTKNMAQSGYDAVSDATKYGYDAISDFYSERFADASRDTAGMREWMSDVWDRATADRSRIQPVIIDQDFIDRYNRSVDAGVPRAPLVPDVPDRSRTDTPSPYMPIWNPAPPDNAFDYVYNPDENIIDRALRGSQRSSGGSSGGSGIEYGTGGRTPAERALERTRAQQPGRSDWMYRG